ncbi:hypothetical protein DSO57_1022648 [Entomophthora muscae]|uniref:Uncharacterized protein n=1 Tax=Entomophthora muscae TaxID=34485 RepID=A0ACC2T392_9FUNG|nr:hypothetical protein DSO57_1022648 [Entomophthora muscae]
MFFLGSYCRMLEEGPFHGRIADFFWMLFLFSLSLLIVGPLLSIPFLSSALTFSMVYVWARRNPDVQMTFMGLFTFPAPYLPFILTGFHVVVRSSLPTSNLVSITLGHIYYFLEDVWPNQPASGGRKLLATPTFVTRLFATSADPDDPHLHQD